MTQSGDARQEIEALRERISTLSAAILRISATLGLDTVLAEVVESARTCSGFLLGCLVFGPPTLRPAAPGRPSRRGPPG